MDIFHLLNNQYTDNTGLSCPQSKTSPFLNSFCPFRKHCVRCCKDPLACFTTPVLLFAQIHALTFINCCFFQYLLLFTPPKDKVLEITCVTPTFQAGCQEAWSDILVLWQFYESRVIWLSPINKMSKCPGWPLTGGFPGCGTFCAQSRKGPSKSRWVEYPPLYFNPPGPQRWVVGIKTPCIFP